MAVTYSFSSGNLIESAEVNQNFTDCAVIADAETITGAWTFTTTAANTNLILDAAVGDYDAGLFFRLETADKWAIYCNDGDSDKLVIYDDANNAAIMEFTLGGDATLNTNLAFDTTARTIAGIANEDLLDKDASETITGDYIFTGDVTLDGQEVATWITLMEKAAVNAMDAKITGLKITNDVVNQRVVNMWGFDSYCDGFGGAVNLARKSTSLTYSDDICAYWNDENTTLVYESQPVHIHSNVGLNTVTQAIPYFKYTMWSLEDNCGYSSVSGDWTTTGSVTEDADNLSVNGGATAYWTGTNYYQTTRTIFFRVSGASLGGGPSGTIAIYNGSTGVTLRTGNHSGVGGYYMVRFQGSDNTCVVERDGDSLGEFDLSAVTTSWYIRFTCNSDIRQDVYFLADDNISSMSSTATLQISADNGSNFETVTNGQLHTFSDTGNQVIAKASISRNANELFLLEGWGLMRVS